MESQLGLATPAHEALVRIVDLEVIFGTGKNQTHALKGVSLEIPVGESVGLVGESGSGKSTLAKALVGINPISAGGAWVDGKDLTQKNLGTRDERRKLIQMIPQDPYSSLSPRRTIGQAIAEALDPVRPDVRRFRDEIVMWLEKVELPAEAIDKYPFQLSGGQRQRVAIARALSIRPRFVIADEITSALDVSVQAEVLELLAQLREELNLTMLFISHNLAVVRHVCDSVVVLFHGEVVEEGEIEMVFAAPEAEYTRSLLASVPGSPGFNIREQRVS